MYSSLYTIPVTAGSPPPPRPPSPGLTGPVAGCAGKTAPQSADGAGETPGPSWTARRADDTSAVGCRLPAESREFTKGAEDVRQRLKCLLVFPKPEHQPHERPHINQDSCGASPATRAAEHPQDGAEHGPHRACEPAREGGGQHRPMKASPRRSVKAAPLAGLAPPRFVNASNHQYKLTAAIGRGKPYRPALTACAGEMVPQTADGAGETPGPLWTARRAATVLGAAARKCRGPHLHLGQVEGGPKSPRHATGRGPRR